MDEQTYDLTEEVVPVLDDVPEDDAAEPDDAEVDHHGS